MLEDQLLRLIVAIYDAAVDPALWPVFYLQLAQFVSADFVGIQVHDFRSRHSRFLSYISRKPEVAESYQTYYNKLNLWRERGKDLFVIGRLVRAEQHTPLELLDRSEFYNDFLKPVGIRYSFNAVLSRSTEHATVFSASRGEPSGSFDDSALQITEQLFPHLSRACAIQQRLAVLAAGEVVLNQIPAGIAFLAADGQVVFANRAAESMVRSRDAFEVRGGFLRVLDSRGDAEFQHAIRVAAAPGNSPESPRALRVNRRSNHRPYQVVVAPIRRRFDQFAGTLMPAAVAWITDPEQELVTDEDLVTQLVGLTAAESRVATLLLSGRSTAEIALRLGIQQNTVRAHLKSMFGKTGVRNQAELIKLLLTSFIGALPK